MKATKLLEVLMITKTYKAMVSCSQNYVCSLVSTNVINLLGQDEAFCICR